MRESDGPARPYAPTVREPRVHDARGGGGAAPIACYGALDLGTNNCRLLIATPDQGRDGGFRVVEAFSRIVRLGEGLSRTGRLDERAMDRAVEALRICADKLRRRRALMVEAVATQACRTADNGEAFVRRVGDETGLKLRIITPREEAELSVAGCAALIDPQAEAALVVDVGGGSTEMSWLTLDGEAPPRLAGWVSVPLGVVTLAECFPEPEAPEAGERWFRAMVEHVRAEVAAFSGADALKPVFAAGRAHMVGTSGAITSLAGLHLNLRRYERERVDGLWLARADCAEATTRLMAMGPVGRAREPCIGPDRADLVLAGAAILQAIQELWPCERVRVADRGLREGLLMSLMRRRSQKSRRRRRGGEGRRRSVQAPPARNGHTDPSTPPET